MNTASYKLPEGNQQTQKLRITKAPAPLWRCGKPDLILRSKSKRNEYAPKLEQRNST